MRAEFLQEHKVPDKGLGRHLVHDPRSRDFPVMAVLDQVRSTVGGKPSRGWYRSGVFDQGSTSSCTVQATAGQLVSQPFATRLGRVAKRRLRDGSERQRLYLDAQHLDPWPGGEPPQSPVYYGSSGLAACKAIAAAGLVPEGWAYRWAFGVGEAIAALDIGPISVGTWWYEGFDRVDRHGVVKLEGQKRGGHQWQVVDYDDEYIRAVNSWGTGWGRNGRFLMRRSDFAALLEDGGDVNIWTPL